MSVQVNKLTRHTVNSSLVTSSLFRNGDLVTVSSLQTCSEIITQWSLVLFTSKITITKSYR